MSISYIVASKSARGVKTTSVQYATVDDALRSLKDRSVGRYPHAVYHRQRRPSHLAGGSSSTSTSSEA